jgi:hypothetical protein
MMTERECVAHTREWHAIGRERARIKAARKAFGAPHRKIKCACRTRAQA